MIHLKAWIKEMRAGLDALEALSEGRNLGVASDSQRIPRIIVLSHPEWERVGIVTLCPVEVRVEESLLPSPERIDPHA